jgi:hypothetical protein
MRSLLPALLLTLALATIGSSEPYWIDWEGEGETAGLPDEFGWSRSWGNWDGQYQGPGASPTLVDGILTFDSLYDPGVCDSYVVDRPGQIDPAPAEVFVMEWRLNVEQVIGSHDPGVAAASNTARIVSFTYTAGALISDFEDDIVIPISSGFHDYRLLSWNMLNYELYIDGDLVHVGTFWQGVWDAYVGWGDFVQGAASLHRWDYFRFGALPAPQAGDLNCDGTLDFQDINPFVQVLTDGEAYQQTYSGCWPENADINDDGSVDFGDINPFVELLMPS